MDCFSNRFNDGLGPPKCYLDNRIGEKVVLLIRYSLYFIHKNGRQNVHLRLLSHLKVDPKSSEESPNMAGTAGKPISQ